MPNISRSWRKSHVLGLHSPYVRAKGGDLFEGGFQMTAGKSAVVSGSRLGHVRFGPYGHVVEIFEPMWLKPWTIHIGAIWKVYSQTERLWAVAALHR